MLDWLKRLFSPTTKPRKGVFWLGQGQDHLMPRKGKSKLADIIAATGAQPGEHVAVYPDGHARILDRPPTLTVVVDNTTRE